MVLRRVAEDECGPLEDLDGGGCGEGKSGGDRRLLCCRRSIAVTPVAEGVVWSAYNLRREFAGEVVRERDYIVPYYVGA